ncbi:IclR family transcriptional regulator [Parafrankia sp. EUN1f]|uniref:IclR family transcriptional regulator n=1 Tax=Parafrankia sp. EUN1f TaxID=102897 RepID=UPI0001C45232|nr:IclR family transcriptional regulator [Parafrankia sp. EUN1f]EFC82351.1 transcriptional regulator, IclR family [Parafrankia sp. EUN1f]
MAVRNGLGSVEPVAPDELSVPSDRASDGISDGVPEAKGSQTVAAVERAADILLHFTRARSASLGITDIASEMGLSKAAVHRVLASLRSRDLIAFDEKARRYSLGPMALVLGLTCLGRLDVREIASAELAQLSEETGETATLSVLAGDQRVYIDQVTPPREVIMSVAVGVPCPLHAGSSSKVFLAFAGEAAIERYLARSLPALTSVTVTDTDRLRRELHAIREQGWAQSAGERQSGAASVAAPVFNHLGQAVAVVSVCGPADRFEAEADRCRAALLAATGRMSYRMGYLPGH